MTGKHRLRRDRQVWTMADQKPPRFWNPADNPVRRTVASATLVVGSLGIVIGLAASGVTAGDAQAAPLDKSAAQIRPVPIIPLPIMTAPRDTDERHDLTAGTNERFLAAVNAAGIPTAGREDDLLRIAQRGAGSHTTDADLEQSVRALFPDIDQVKSEKFVYQVRIAFPGEHSTDTDDDGR